MTARYRNRSGMLTPEENQKLSDFEAGEGLWLSDRPTLAQDYQRCIQLHAQMNCSWWHRGQVLVRMPGMDPEARLR